MSGWGCGDGAPSDATNLLAVPATGDPSDALQQRGPICSTCLLNGGESSDFDGGRDTICPDFIRAQSVNEADVQAAGWDTAAFRQRVERSFESELRWTDLTSTTALPRSTPISGFQSETSIRATVVLDGSWQRYRLDPGGCVDGVCTLDNRVEDCASWITPDFFNTVSVGVETQDGAIDTSLSGRVWVRAPAEAEWEPRLGFVASSDVTKVHGALRIEPLEEAPYGQLTLAVAYFDSGVRGRLSVDFTNGAWPGTGQVTIDETPLAAKFPIDACSHDVLPTPLSSPHPLLDQRNPGELLDGLRAAVSAADGSGRWLQTGQDVGVDVELGTPEYACVGLWHDDGAIAGQITNVPVRLHTSDGRLDWSEDAIYRFDPRPGATTHQLSVDRVYIPTAPILSEVFGAFTFPPNGSWRYVSLRGTYPGTAELTRTAPDLVLRVGADADCAGNDAPCNDAYRAAYVEQCLSAPARAECIVSPAQVDWSRPDPY